MTRQGRRPGAGARCRGWALTKHLIVLETGERYPDPARAALVTPLFLPVFRGPSSRSERMTLLTLGTVVEVGAADPNASYFPIRFPGGAIGYAEGNTLI